MDLCRKRGVWGNKKIVEKEKLLVYPNFNKRFGINKGASNYQLGAVIIQEFKPITFTVVSL